MKTPIWLKKMFTVDDSALSQQFLLTDAGGSDAPEPETARDQQTSLSHGNTKDHSSGKAERAPDKAPASPSRKPEETSGAGNGATNTAGQSERTPIKPIPMKEFIQKAEEKSKTIAPDLKPEEARMPTDIDEIKQQIQTFFHAPENGDIVTRDVAIGRPSSWRGLLVFVDGLADKMIINTHILEPLMLLSHLEASPLEKRLNIVSEHLVPGNQIAIEHTWPKVIDAILTGSTAVFIDGCDAALMVESKGWEHRMVGLAQTETVVRGPHDAFTENFRANTGLVRSRLRSKDLVTKMMSVGKLAKTDVAVMYIKNVTNPSLVQEVERRISAIEVDFLADAGVFQQFIEDSPHTFVPQVLTTERPDRIAHMLNEGHVAIFVGHSPYVIAVPVVFWTLVQTSEDAYLRNPFGTYLRFIRWTAIILALMTPALYISVTNFHPEMIPTHLMLAIAASREQVPFPVIVEIVLMEFSIELIREAGIRIPSVIGPTIGIVGALIIGQAAVQAGIVSPLLVIVIAITALASFTIPNYDLQMGIRVGRFIFLIVASMFGFYGISLLLAVMLARLSVQKSFGVPLFSPVTPSMDSSTDVLMRGPSYTMNERPTYLHTLRSTRQHPITRPWSPETQPSQGNQSPGRDTEHKKGDANGQDTK